MVSLLMILIVQIYVFCVNLPVKNVILQTVINVKAVIHLILIRLNAIFRHVKQTNIGIQSPLIVYLVIKFAKLVMVHLIINV